MDLNENINKIPQDQLSFYIKHGKKVNSINGFKAKPLLKYSFKIVKYEVPTLINQGKFVELAKLLLDGKTGVLNATILLNFVLWVINEIENINQIEQNNLNSEPDNDMINSGINQLDVFGYLNVVDTLAGGDILKWESILALPYENVLDKMIKNTIESKIQKNYQKLISKKK
jgi:hypothetical protein